MIDFDSRTYDLQPVIEQINTPLRCLGGFHRPGHMGRGHPYRSDALIVPFEEIVIGPALNVLPRFRSESRIPSFDIAAQFKENKHIGTIFGRGNRPQTVASN